MARKHIRNTETGEFISEEDAKTMDKKDYIVDTDFDKGAFLEEVYEKLRNVVTRIIDVKSNTLGELDNELVLTLNEIKKVFEDYGAKFDK